MPALTALSVEKYAKKPHRYEVPDSKVAGLRLIVQPSGAKSWAVRYSRHNRDRRFTLGPFPTLGLDAARKAAGVALAKVAAGTDPGEERKTTRRTEERERASAVPIKAAWERYLAEHVAPSTAESTADQTTWLFTKFILPAIGRVAIGAVTPGECKAVWDKERKRGNPSNAHKVFVALRGFFNWLRAELIMTKPSPLEGLVPPEGSKAGERTLNAAELRLVWLAAGEMDYPFGPFVKLLILTLARRNEVARMTKAELDGALWTIPGARTKNKREHVVPLAGLALDTIKRCDNYTSEAGWLFTTDGEHAASNFSKNKCRLDAIVTRLNDGKPIPPWKLHDLRRTGDTEMHELGVAPHIVEACVNHVSGHKRGVAGTYNKAKYLPEKRAAFDLWAERLNALTSLRQ